MIIYSPYIEGTIPAFVKEAETIKVPYEMNPGVNFNEVEGFSLRIREQNGQKIIATLSSDSFSSTEVAFSYDTSDFNPSLNQYYKIQLAYLYQDQEGKASPSPYSTVGIIKCIEKPTYTFGTIGNNIVLTYPKISNIENLYKYSINIISNSQVITTFNNIANGDKETYSHYFWFENGKKYEVILNITTLNLAEFISTIIIDKTNSEDDLSELAESAKINYDEGQIEININDTDTSLNQRLYRISNDNPSWELITEGQIINFKDNVIQHGEVYEYRVAEEDSNGLFVPYGKITNIGPAYFEDMFLSDANKTLKIRFNPKMSSLKNTLLESKIDTLGSKYPFFFRNGIVKYKEFPISGLISYLQDEQENFMSKEEDLGLENDVALRTTTQHDSPAAAINVPTTSLKDYNITAERKFKMAVLDWLNNGQPKLLKTPTEGTFIVRLINVSLSPEEQLGRMLHSFSATAYEIADFNLNNCYELNLVPSLSLPDGLESITSFNRIIKSLNIGEEETDTITLNYVENINFSNFPSNTEIKYTLFGSTVENTGIINGDGYINETLKSLTIPKVATGEISYIQLETNVISYQTLSLHEALTDENSSELIIKAQLDEYISEAEIIGANQNATYQIDENDIIYLGNSTVYLKNLQVKRIVLNNGYGIIYTKAYENTTNLEIMSNEVE